MTLRQVTKVPKNMMKIVKSKTDGRLDQILAEELGLTRNKAQEIIATVKKLLKTALRLKVVMKFRITNLSYHQI